MFVLNEIDSSFNKEIGSFTQYSTIRLRSLLRVSSHSRWDGEPRISPYTTIVYVRNAVAFAEVEGERFEVPENHFLLIRPGFKASFSAEPAGKTLLYFALVEIRNVSSFDDLTEPYLLGKNTHIDDLFYHLYRSTRMKMHLETTPDALISLIIERCLEAPRPGDPRAELYRLFCDYVENNIAGDLSAEHLGEVLCYNPDYISRVVKQYTGKTLKEYISAEKMYLAKSMLTDEKIPLKEISTSLGFASEELFRKFFKYYTNLTPMEYRRERRCRGYGCITGEKNAAVK